MKNIFKLVGMLFVTMLFAGCATTDNLTVTTKTIPQAVPLLYSPAPPQVDRPELPHLTISQEDLKIDGKVVQAYAASVQALIGYSEQLEKIVSSYKDVNIAYSELRSKLIADWKAKTGTDIVLPDVPQSYLTVDADTMPPTTLPNIPPVTPPTKKGPVIPNVDDLLGKHK